MHAPLPGTVSKLVKEFRRQRPIRGGSLLITIFGDAIAPRGGAVTLASLIQLAQPFGLPERLVRTAIGRLGKDGWLASKRSGRASEYHLALRGRTQFAAATERIYGAESTPWRGTWTVVLIGELNAARRAAAREVLHWAGFGEPQPGVLAHPTLGPKATRALLPVAARKATILEARIDDPAELASWAQHGWRLAELDSRYARFVDRFAPTQQVATRADPLTAWVLRTLLIHEYRKIHLRDPLLPRDLLPNRWSGVAAYQLCRELYGSVFLASEEFIDTVARRLDGPLPPFNGADTRRFGGLPHKR